MHFIRRKEIDARYRKACVSLTKAWEGNKEARKKRSKLGFWY
jgi:hypothetical protein